jgi:hypothetical protein
MTVAAHKPMIMVDGIQYLLQDGDVIQADSLGINITPLLTNDDPSTVTLGMPMYVYDSGGLVRKAINTTLASSKILGLVYDASVLTTNPVTLQTKGQFTMSDWTSVIGSQYLTPNTYYFLDSTTGRLVSTAPLSGFITCVGIAINHIILDLNIETPIKL